MKKMAKLLVVIALLGSVIPVMAQEYKTREVPNAPAFTSIEISAGDANIFFSQGENHSFAINGPAKALKATKIKVKGNTLFINYNEPLFLGDDDLNIYITAPQLNRINVSGEADFKSKTSFQGKELTIITRQNGEVSMKNVATTQINIDAKGSSSVELDYIQADMIHITALDRAEVELSGNTNQMNVVKKGMFAEIDTSKLNVTHSTNNNAGSGSKQIAKDGSIDFIFND